MTIWEYGAIAIAIWAFAAGAAVGAIAVYVWTQQPAKPIRQYRRQLFVAGARIRYRQTIDALLLRNRPSRRTR